MIGYSFNSKENYQVLTQNLITFKADRVIHFLQSIADLQSKGGRYNCHRKRVSNRKDRVLRKTETKNAKPPDVSTGGKIRNTKRARPILGDIARCGNCPPHLLTALWCHMNTGAKHSLPYSEFGSFSSLPSTSEHTSFQLCIV